MPLHPHIKHFIRGVILAEMGEKLGPSKKYQWKEGIMTEVQEDIMSKLSEIETQEDLAHAIDESVNKFHAEKIIPLLDMIKRTLRNIPIQIIRQTASKTDGEKKV